MLSVTLPMPNSWSTKGYVTFCLPAPQNVVFPSLSVIQLVKLDFTARAFIPYVLLTKKEMLAYFNNSSAFQGTAAVVDIDNAMAEIIIFTASRCLQGKELRERLNSTFAQNHHDLDMGFTPINLIFLAFLYLAIESETSYISEWQTLA